MRNIIKIKEKEMLLSILTPTWNRRSSIERLYLSLEAQKWKGFVWVVGNDGSDDDTLEFLIKIRESSTFPIKLVSSSKRIGKTSIDNLLLSSIETKYYLNCDSDDWLLPNALLEIIEYTEKYSKENDIKIDAIFAKNISSNGEQITKTSLKENFVYSLKKCFSEINGDATILLLSEKFKNVKHYEVDFVVTEFSAYRRLIDNGNSLFYNETLKVMDRSQPNSISYSKGLKYTRGSAYACRDQIKSVNVDKDAISSIQFDIKYLANFARYTICGETGYRFYFDTCNYAKISIFKQSISYLIGYLISLVDIFSGHLQRTHREFEKNYKSTIVEWM
jgi:glycosyltransferase involved in cell wall biosynthesis